MFGWLQALLVLSVLVAVHVPLGDYMARALDGGRHLKAERLYYRVCGIDPDREQGWRQYLLALLAFSVVSIVALFALLVLTGCALIIDPVPLRTLSTQSYSARTLLGLLVLFLFAVLAALFLFRTTRSTLWGGRLMRTLAATKSHLSLNPKALAAGSLAFILHLLNFLIAYLFAKALGLSITYLQVAIIVAVVMLLSMVPVTINGHGLRELLLIAYFTQLGLGLDRAVGSGVREIAIAFSLLLVANDLLWSIPGGIWYKARFNAPIRNVN